MVFPFVKGLKQWMNAYNNNNKQTPSITSSTSYPIIQLAKKSPSNPQLSKDEQRKLKHTQQPGGHQV